LRNQIRNRSRATQQGIVRVDVQMDEGRGIQEDEPN